MEVRRKSTLDLATIRYVTEHDEEQGPKVIKCLEKIFGKATNSEQVKQIFDKSNSNSPTSKKKPYVQIPRNPPQVPITPHKAVSKSMMRKCLKNVKSQYKTKKSANPSMDVRIVVINGENYAKPPSLLKAEGIEADAWKLASATKSKEEIKKRCYDVSVRSLGKPKASIPQLISDVNSAHIKLKKEENEIDYIQNTLNNMHSSVQKYKSNFEKAKECDESAVIEIVNRIENPPIKISTISQSTSYTPRGIYPKYRPATDSKMLRREHKRNESSPINTLEYFIEPQSMSANKRVVQRRKVRREESKKSNEFIERKITSMRLLSSLSNKITSTKDVFVSLME